MWGDFSLSVKKEHDNQLFRFHPHGDVRYLPPEFLGDTPPQVEFEDLRRGDVYALGLVLWEISQCCLVEGVYQEIHTLILSQHLRNGRLHMLSNSVFIQEHTIVLFGIGYDNGACII